MIYDTLKFILHTHLPNKRANVMIGERLFDLFEEVFHKQNAFNHFEHYLIVNELRIQNWYEV